MAETSAPVQKFHGGYQHTTLRCANFKCRVAIFTGTPVYPLNTCPVCQHEGQYDV